MPDLPENWRFFIECKDCKTLLRVLSKNWSLEMVGEGNRVVILTVPQQCPECRNLKLVPHIEEEN